MFIRDIITQENTKGFTDFMKDYGELEYQKSFATNTTVKHPLRTNGLISTYDLFQDLTGAGEPVENIKEFLNEYGDFEIIKDSYDNSYNYCGYLDNYVSFSMFELENDQTLVTLSIGLGLDPRGGYTENVALVFESEYDFLETFDENFELLGFDFTVNGEEYYGSFDGQALSEFGYLYIMKKDGEDVYSGEQTLATGDVDDIIEAVAEALEVEEYKIKIDQVNYFWFGSR